MKIVLVLAMLAFVTGAEAQMMPAGPSPESGFAGVWRVIGAVPAPWAAPRKLTKADAPLLEYAVAFADKEVKGPAPLGCAAARYSSGDTYPVHLFGGRLADDRDGARLKTINLSQGETTTYRVLCGSAVRDYYMGDKSDLVMAEGDVIYTLERPAGMNPEQYKAGFSGPGFDCMQAKTAGEQMICTDAALSKADLAMTVAYDRLRKTETPESFATVQAAQRGWIAHVSKSCGANGKMPDDQGAINDMNQCLIDNYGDRAERLDAIKVEKSGALTLEPRMRFFSRATPDTDDADIYPWMTGRAQAALFNAWIAKRLALDKRRMDDKTLFPGDSNQKLHARRTYRLIRFTPKILSLEIYSEDETGGPPPALNEEKLDWDIANARAQS
jgi:uncharacterized protein